MNNIVKLIIEATIPAIITTVLGAILSYIIKKHFPSDNQPKNNITDSELNNINITNYPEANSSSNIDIKNNTTNIYNKYETHTQHYHSTPERSSSSTTDSFVFIFAFFIVGLFLYHFYASYKSTISFIMFVTAIILFILTVIPSIAFKNYKNLLKKSSIVFIICNLVIVFTGFITVYLHSTDYCLNHNASNLPDEFISFLQMFGLIAYVFPLLLMFIYVLHLYFNIYNELSRSENGFLSFVLLHTNIKPNLFIFLTLTDCILSLFLSSVFPFTHQYSDFQNLFNIL